MRRRGWWKTILFALFFQPAAVDFNPLNGFTWNEGCALADERGPILTRRRMHALPMRAVPCCA